MRIRIAAIATGLVLLAALAGCASEFVVEEEDTSFTIIATSGAEITMDGTWFDNC